MREQGGLLIPPPLRPRDMVALVSPGAAVARRHRMETLDAAIAALQRTGYRVQVMPHARGQAADGRAGTAEERADDLNAAFADPEVRLVLATVGGGGTLDLVAGGRLDWEALRRTPKILCGFSDFAFATVAAHVRLGLVTLDGPLAVFHWGSRPEPAPYSTECFLRVATSALPAGRLRPPRDSAPDPWEFAGLEDARSRLRPASPWRWLRPGRVQGRLLALRADQLLDLAKVGVPVRLDGRIWCLDPLPDGSTVPALQRASVLGLLNGLAGMVVGRRWCYSTADYFPPAEAALSDLDRCALEVTSGMDIPILADVDCGHSVPRLTIPNGVIATLDAEEDRFSIDEPATRGGGPVGRCRLSH